MSPYFRLKNYQCSVFVMRGFFKWWGFFCAFLNVEIKYAGGNTLGLIFELSSY